MITITIRTTDRCFDVISRIEDLPYFLDIVEASSEVINFKVCWNGKYVSQDILDYLNYYEKWKLSNYK